MGPAPWHWRAVLLRMTGVTLDAIAADVGKTKRSVERVVNGAWGREQRREVGARAAEQGVAEGVDPVVKFQAAGGRMAEIMLTAAEDERAPLKKAIIAEKNLALGGWVAVQKSLTLTVEARIRDREALPDDVLEAFATGGAVPDALKALVHADASGTLRADDATVAVDDRDGPGPERKDDR